MPNALRTAYDGCRQEDKAHIVLVNTRLPPEASGRGMKWNPAMAALKPPPAPEDLARTQPTHHALIRGSESTFCASQLVHAWIMEGRMYLPLHSVELFGKAEQERLITKIAFAGTSLCNVYHTEPGVADELAKRLTIPGSAGANGSGLASLLVQGEQVRRLFGFARTPVCNRSWLSYGALWAIRHLGAQLYTMLKPL